MQIQATKNEIYTATKVLSEINLAQRLNEIVKFEVNNERVDAEREEVLPQPE